MDRRRILSYAYLCAIPVLTFVLAFTTGHISYKLYVPIWLVNVGVMSLAVWTIGKNAFTSASTDKRQLAWGACFLVLPVALLSILFGMGAPPGTLKEWVDTATEQKVRFDILLADGILVALGLSLIRLVLQGKGGLLLTQLGYTAVLIAIPLFFINTSFWHSFALESYKIRVASGSGRQLEWFAPAAQQIWVITIGQVLLTYFSAAMFAGALRQTGIFQRMPAAIYIAFSVIAMVSILLFPLYPGATAFSGFPYYPFMIPAVPIMVLYYLGVNLLKRAAGNQS